MPRKKTIDENQIPLGKINEEIIEMKNCLGVKLVFNTPLPQRYWHTMRTFYKIRVDAAGQIGPRAIKDSWKGLFMMLLSLVYCKLGKDTAATLVSKIGYVSKKYKPYLSVTWDYEVFLNDDERTKVQCVATLEGDEVLLIFIKEFAEEINKRSEQRREEEQKKLLLELPASLSFEEIAVPPSWRACYFKTYYDSRNLLGNIMMLATYLDLDIENTIVTTEYYEETPFKYTTRPVKYQDTSGLLCSCPGKFKLVHGIEVIDSERFSLLINSNIAKQVDISISPNQLVQTDVRILGYNLTPSTMEQLCTYFPFMESEFHTALSTMDGNAWVVFDSKHLGKWG